jgi:signal peptidase II
MSEPFSEFRPVAVQAPMRAKSGPPSSRAQRLRAYGPLWAIAVTIFVLDQVTKFWIDARMPLGTYGPPGGITLIEDFFYLVHVGNTGAAWSMFSGKSAWLALLAFVTLGAIYFWRHSLGLRQRIVQVSFGLLCGGIVGNLVDRLLHGHVIDFLQVHWAGWYFPSFNVADSAITAGAVLLILDELRRVRRAP